MTDSKRFPVRPEVFYNGERCVFVAALWSDFTGMEVTLRGVMSEVIYRIPDGKGIVGTVGV